MIEAGSRALQAPATSEICSCPQTAGFGERAAAVLIDLGLLTALHLAYFIVLAILIFKAVPLDLQTLLAITMTYALFFLVMPFFLVMSYFTVLHAWGGQTVGKIIMGIKVVGADTNSLPAGRAFLRTTGYFVSALPLGAGFLWTVLDREGRSWHDRLAGTKVVHTLQTA
jgi:uncharacterized RDD family membrane protein YckC